jgi:alkylation response protein AidB-like acyl-CoA dehydrogenase
LTVYNQAQANTVNVDVSSVFGASGTVKAYNAQDYFSDVQTLTITAGVITVNMQAANRTVATPDGWVAPAKTFPDFGAFVLIKQ